MITWEDSKYKTGDRCADSSIIIDVWFYGVPEREFAYKLSSGKWAWEHELVMEDKS